MKYFIYCRKSTESEDRQILSIESQINELKRAFADSPNIEIVDVLTESFSAKAPGRPIFNAMVTRITNGEADGIISWHPDRLARNSIDGGHIIYLLDRGILKDLKFANFSFENNPQGKLMLSVLLGFSKYYVDSLSENVKRGNRAKLNNGWLPNAPPIGYRNDKESKTIVPDEERFALMQQLFALALTGNYSLRQLQAKCVDWGLTTRPRKRVGGKTISISGLHKALHNPFYAGMIVHGGRTYAGAHQPILTMKQHKHLLELLGRFGKQAPKKRDFAFTGLIRCGACGLMVTAECKTNRFGSQYTYYHCTRRGKNERCKQPSIEVKALEAEFENHLRSIWISKKQLAWITQHIEDTKEKAKQASAAVLRSLEATVAKASRTLNTLVSLRAQEQITEEEFLEQRRTFAEEKQVAEENLAEAQDDGNSWFEPALDFFSFSNRALDLFREGENDLKRKIVSATCSNLVLQDKILRITATKPFKSYGGYATRSDLCTRVNVIRTPNVSNNQEQTKTIERIQKLTNQDKD